jgi:hypothetical protein
MGLASDGVEGGVINGVHRAVRADEGGGVSLRARGVEVDLLGKPIPGRSQRYSFPGSLFTITEPSVASATAESMHHS